MAKLTKRRLILGLIFLFKKNKKIPETDKRLIIKTATREKIKEFIVNYSQEMTV